MQHARSDPSKNIHLLHTILNESIRDQIRPHKTKHALKPDDW